MKVTIFINHPIPSFHYAFQKCSCSHHTKGKLATKYHGTVSLFYSHGNQSVHEHVYLHLFLSTYLTNNELDNLSSCQPFSIIFARLHSRSTCRLHINCSKVMRSIPRKCPPLQSERFNYFSRPNPQLWHAFSLQSFSWSLQHHLLRPRGYPTLFRASFNTISLKPNASYHLQQ